jgi:aspartyl-tRNA(Asn)/glutamyl-tRNA(Gln) amidotransferase subunit A
MIDTWWRLGIAELAAQLRSGERDAVALTEACFERIERLDPAINTMVVVDRDGARKQALASVARLRAGRPVSPLDGIPITIKDNLLVKGLPATWGSRGYADYVPEQDELPVERLRAAGAVIIGKTNVPELTLEGYTSNRLFGTTRNAWDPRLTPGGSSGGAASGVAAGLVPAAIGTDGGGSIRRPACHTGLIGFKPSIGRYARAGGFPELLYDLEVIGTLTRSVTDTLLLDVVLAGPSPRDRRALPPGPPARGVRGLKILYVPRFGDAPLDPEVEAATDAAAEWLAGEGHRVETGPIPFDLAEANDIWRIIGRSAVAHLFQAKGPAFESVMGPFVTGLAQEGRAITAAEYVGALERLGRFRSQIADLFKRYDLIFTPSAAALPWPADETHPPEIDGRPAGPRGHAVYTGWVNVSGHPGISLPLGQSRASLPIGGQFIAGFAADATLLAFAQGFMGGRGAALPWPALSEG